MLELKGKSVVWDEAKNRKNLRDHGIAFPEAAMAFLDPCFVLIYDEDHSSLDETRWMGLGMVNHSLFALCFVERGDELRLYSARKSRNTFVFDVRVRRKTPHGRKVSRAKGKTVVQ